MTAKNKNSRIVSKNRMGYVDTKTARRDEGETNFAISTDIRNNSSQLTIFGQGGQTATKLTGRQARTLYLLLQKHLDEVEWATPVDNSYFNF